MRSAQSATLLTYPRERAEVRGNMIVSTTRTELLNLFPAAQENLLNDAICLHGFFQIRLRARLFIARTQTGGSFAPFIFSLLGTLSSACNITAIRTPKLFYYSHYLILSDAFIKFGKRVDRSGAAGVRENLFFFLRHFFYSLLRA